MRRFRFMNVYVASLVLLLALVIASVAWLRRPGVGEARADSGPPVVTADATQRADVPTSAPAETAKDVQVSIDNFAFKPRELSVAAGTTITWVNHDDVPHTATGSGEQPAFDSKALDTDDKYSFTFTKPGTYKYFCKVHTHMTGTVVVK